MIVKLAPEQDIEAINVVRREEQAEMLNKLGAKHVVVTGSDEAKWKAELQSKITELDAKLPLMPFLVKCLGISWI
jgi:NADPH2:quinone reductase